MTTHTIDIEGLPEGWEVKRIGVPVDTECYVANGDVVSFMAGVTVPVVRIIVQKSKPRRIVLEETDEKTDPLLYQPIKIEGLCVLMVAHNKIWRVKEE